MYSNKYNGARCRYNPESRQKYNGKYDGSSHRCGCNGDAYHQVNADKAVKAKSSDAVNSGYPLAMVYSVSQTFRDLYSLEEGLKAGTVFAELDLPFGEGCIKGGACRD